MPTAIHESVSVAVVFSNGSIHPRYFLWNGKKITIDAVSFMWRTMVGAVHLLHFTVTAQQTLYELVFDTRALTWKLEHTSVDAS